MKRGPARKILSIAAGLGLAGGSLLAVGHASAYFPLTVRLNVTTPVDNATPCTLNGAGTQSVGSCSLRGAILTANGYPSTDQVINIIVPAGNYNLTLGTLDVNSLNNIVQIFGAGQAGLSTTAVNGSGNAAPASVFEIDTATTITGMKITGGTGNSSDSGNGGGLWIQAALDLTSVVVTGNLACSAFTGSTCTGTYAEGGGIFLANSSPFGVTLSYVSATFNTAGKGGGLASEAGDASSLNGTTDHIDHNTACTAFTNRVCTGDGQGGGIYNDGEGISLSGGTISYNTAGSLAASNGTGGGVYNGQDTVQLVTEQIVGNTAGNNGGGTYDTSGAISVITTSVLHNVAGQQGGGLYEDYIAHVSNSLIFYNTAGGTFECTTSGGTTTCKSTTGSTVGNCATLYPSATLCSSNSGQGGGIFSDYEYPTLTGSTVSNNTAVSIAGYSNCSGGLGGGILSQWILTLTGSSINSNVADCGGGVWNGEASSPATAEGSVEAMLTSILFNHALEDGGAMWTHTLNSIVLNSSVVTSNSAGRQTGGIWDAATGDVLLGAGAVVSGNTALVGLCKNVTKPCI